MKNTSKPTMTIAALAVTLVALGACGSSNSDTTTSITASSALAPATSSSGSNTGSTGKGVARTASEIKTGVAYASTSKAQTLDLYLPISDGSEPVPVVVLIHGGAFKGGSSTMEAAHAKALVARGIAAASVNYRLSGEATFPAGAQDVKAAVRWLRANAATYGFNIDAVGAWGESAGGWMANMLGVTGDQATVFDDASLGNAGQSSAVQAVVSWFGPTDFTTMDAQANQTKCSNPDVHDTADSPESIWLGGAVATSSKAKQTSLPAYVATAKILPPWYLAHGDSDCQVTPGQSAQLKTALDAKGVTATYQLLPGAKHGDPAFDQTQLTPSVDFLAKALGA